MSLCVDTAKKGKERPKASRNTLKSVGQRMESMKLSAALRWFAVGSVCDISVVHGISHIGIFNCCLLSVKKQSRFAGCAGAMDGLLAWMETPSEKSCEQAQCGPKKFFCRRKKNFRLILQGTVDHNGRFLHISVWHPASTSDHLSFATMDLRHRLEKPGFLAPGLCLFGDNACVNTACGHPTQGCQIGKQGRLQLSPLGSKCCSSDCLLGF